MITAVTLLCAVVVIAYTLHVINHMSRRTDHLMRLAFVTLCFAEFALLAGPLFGLKTAGRFEVMVLNLSVLLFVLFDRRRRRYSHS